MIYDVGTLVTIGTDPSITPGATLFSLANGTPEDPTAVTVTWGWWTLQGTTWVQQGTTSTAVWPNGTVSHTTTGGFTVTIDTTGHGGQTCKYRIAGTGACQAAFDGQFQVGASPYA